ncbi:peptide methionine sulfoxide reductase MsrA [Chytridium lagenaria]|nr:peptide methionine sulfoxide reductase MsrA [Chytridium lagenaria]
MTTQFATLACWMLLVLWALKSHSVASSLASSPTPSASATLGGAKSNPSYKEVCTGTTNHAEVVHFQFDPTVTPFPDRQGNDRGTQYRSAVFYHDEEQKRIAEEVVERVKPAFGAKGVATDYLTKNPTAMNARPISKGLGKVASEFGGGSK